MSRPPLIIVGSDTDAGKTLVTGLLFRHLTAKHLSVTTQKWVQTGSQWPPLDLQTHYTIANSPLNLPQPSPRAPYCFPDAVSPHLAAKWAQTPIDTNDLISHSDTLLKHTDYLLIEGAGGLLVPLTATETLVDLIQKTGWPVLVVIANRVGCINHGCLTLDHLKQRHIPVLGTVLTTVAKLDPRVEADNQKMIQDLSKTPTLLTLPHAPINTLYDHAKDGLDAIVTTWNQLA